MFLLHNWCTRTLIIFLAVPFLNRYIYLKKQTSLHAQGNYTN